MVSSTTSDLFPSITVSFCLGTESEVHGTCLTVGITGQHSSDGSFCGESGGTTQIFQVYLASSVDLSGSQSTHWQCLYSQRCAHGEISSPTFAEVGQIYLITEGV